MSIVGFGNTMVGSLGHWLSIPENVAMLRSLEAAGVRMDTAVRIPDETSNSSLSGKTVVVTGNWSFGKRGDVEAWVEARGGKIASSVSAKTDILAYGEKAGSKLAKAEKINAGGGEILILDEEAFLRFEE